MNDSVEEFGQVKKVSFHAQNAKKIRGAIDFCSIFLQSSINNSLSISSSLDLVVD
jgi:hypothetical protein